MKFKFIQHVKEEYTKAKLQGFKESINLFCFTQIKENNNERCPYCEFLLKKCPLNAAIQKRWPEAEETIRKDLKELVSQINHNK